MAFTPRSDIAVDVSQVEVLETRILPHTSPDGRPMQRVVVRWKNKGPEPIGGLFARIDAYDAAGNLSPDSAGEYCVWAVEKTENLAQPGAEIDTEPRGGFILITGAQTGNPAVRAMVTPTRAERVAMQVKFGED